MWEAWVGGDKNVEEEDIVKAKAKGTGWSNLLVCLLPSIHRLYTVRNLTHFDTLADFRQIPQSSQFN